MPIKAHRVIKSSEHTEITTAQHRCSHLRRNFCSTKLLFAFHFFKSICKKHDFSLAKEPFEAAQIAFEVKIEESFRIHAPVFPPPPKNEGTELGEKFISWNRRPRLVTSEAFKGTKWH